jgi:hypothetical protein
MFDPGVSHYQYKKTLHLLGYTPIIKPYLTEKEKQGVSDLDVATFC